MPTTCWGTRDRWGYLPKPSIKNYELWLDWQAHQLHTPLVGGADHHTRSRRSKELSLEDLHLFQHPSGPMWGPPKPGLHHAPCSQVPYEGYIPAQWPILPTCPVEAPTIDPGLCSGAAILGRGSQPPGTWWSLPFGNECSWIKVAHGKVHLASRMSSSKI